MAFIPAFNHEFTDDPSLHSGVLEYFMDQGYVCFPLPGVPVATPSALPTAAQCRSIMLDILDAGAQALGEEHESSCVIHTQRGAILDGALYAVHADRYSDMFDAGFKDLAPSMKWLKSFSTARNDSVMFEEHNRDHIKTMCNLFQRAIVYRPGTTNATLYSDDSLAVNARPGDIVVRPDPEFLESEELPFTSVVATFYGQAHGGRLGYTHCTNALAYHAEGHDTLQCIWGLVLVDDLSTEIGHFLSEQDGEVKAFGYVGFTGGASRVAPMCFNSIADPYLRRALRRLPSKRTPVSKMHMRLEKKKARKLGRSLDTKNLPLEFYTLVIPEDQSAYFRSERRAVEYERRAKYRHMRAGHFRLKIRRGPLPMPFRDREWCVKHDYEIYDAGALPLPRQEQMSLRGHAMRGDKEWVALKITHVSAHMVGDESLPYREAVRTIEGAT